MANDGAQVQLPPAGQARGGVPAFTEEELGRLTNTQLLKFAWAKKGTRGRKSFEQLPAVYSQKAKGLASEVRKKIEQVHDEYKREGKVPVVLPEGRKRMSKDLWGAPQEGADRAFFCPILGVAGIEVGEHDEVDGDLAAGILAGKYEWHPARRGTAIRTPVPCSAVATWIRTRS